MKSVNSLVSKALQNETKTSQPISTQKFEANKPLRQDWTAAIFKKFALSYGGLWTTRLGTQQQTDDMLKEWGRGLHGLTGEEIKHGLDTLPDMPPSLPAFRRLCRQYLCAAHRPFARALPKPPPDYERGREHIEEIKALLKKSPSRED